MYLHKARDTSRLHQKQDNLESEGGREGRERGRERERGSWVLIFNSGCRLDVDSAKYRKKGSKRGASETDRRARMTGR